VFFFSTSYFSHVFNASMIILVLYLLFSKTMKAELAAVPVGFLAGLTILIEYQGLIFISAIGLYIWYRYGHKKVLYYSCGVGIPLCLLLLYNYSTLGSPFALPHQWLADNNRDKVHGIGLLGFTLPRIDHLIGLLILPEQGLFFYSPILMLAPVGWFRAYRSADTKIRDLSMLSLLATIPILLWISSYADWRGGATFGPRQIVSTLPFFMVGVAFGIQRIPRLVWIPLLAISILTNWLGAQYGFAKDVFEHWKTFSTQGFALPSMLAIVSHSRSSNSLVLLVSHYSWVIDICYLLLAIIVGATCIRVAQFTQRSGQPQVFPVSSSGSTSRETQSHVLPGLADQMKKQ